MREEEIREEMREDEMRGYDDNSSVERWRG